MAGAVVPIGTDALPLVPYYRTARRHWGDLSDWWPGETPWEIAVSAVLTQHTRWDRAWQALERLREAGLRNPEAVARARRSVLERLLRPVGGFRRKARTLQALARRVLTECGGDLRRLGEWPSSGPGRPCSPCTASAPRRPTPSCFTPATCPSLSWMPIRSESFSGMASCRRAAGGMRTSPGR